MTIGELLNKLHNVVPKKIAMSFDNVGLLIGNELEEVKGVYVTLDINEEVIEFVINNKINTIISHHPIIFSPLKQILNSNNVQRKIIKCIENNINVICCHTNLDAVKNGMNDYLIEFLGFEYEKVEILEINELDNNCGIGRILTLKQPMEYLEVIKKVKTVFKVEKLRCVNSNKEIVNRICLINGSGNSMIKDCFNKNVDVVITGDITYHTAFDSIENQINLIDIGHFTSENEIYLNLMRKLLNSIDVNKNIYFDTLLKEVYTYM